MKLKDLLEQYGEYEVEEWFEIGTDGVADEKGIKLKKPKQKTVWDLAKDDDNYFVVYNDGDVVGYRWCDTGLGKAFRDQGNVFLTRKEAEEEAERRAVETLLLKHGGRRWFKEGKENWFITFDRELDEWRFLYSTRDQRQGAIYFDSKVELTEAVEQIGSNRIRKALFEVR